jgi:hypothetical protein
MKFLIQLYIVLFFSTIAFGQISPGELVEYHAHLEGISNCVKCHELGEKVSDEKCLACHTELKTRIDQKKGYHSSPAVYKKGCTTCHSDHLTRKYDIVHLDKDKFDHRATGFTLEGKHKEKLCQDCHKTENITDPQIKKKKLTYLGLNLQCLSCHKDYHQQTLKNDCASCHNFESFKRATKFDHQITKFPLKGKHVEVACLKCHPVEKKNGQDFQQFTGIAFENCSACHKDVHQGKFGSDCRKCHSEESFSEISEIKTFDHSKTGFPLEGKHRRVDCKSCHKGRLTDKIKHTRCMDCHKDYHNGEFVSRNSTSDCRDCHSESSFLESSFTTEQHNKGVFKLEGAHLATPCFSCHKKGKEWKFQGLKKNCVDCHKNIHKNFMDEKYIPEERCDKCHSVTAWNKITFDHKITKFELLGKHADISCRDCHYKTGINNKPTQLFAELKPDCEGCHVDVHQKQFAKNRTTNCALCHGFKDWKADRFNHDQTRFKLDGKHKNVECKKCHLENKAAKPPFIQYKNTERKCTSCHF